MALQLPQTLLSQVANFGQQPMQNLQQGLLTPVQVAAQQPAGIGALVSGLGGMFGVIRGRLSNKSKQCFVV